METDAMKLGVMQPYFFPHLGYFQLIAEVDRFVLLDDVQYIRHGWVNRNRILREGNGWKYITVPLRSHSRETLIRNIVIDSAQKWKERILGQLHVYKSHSERYAEIRDLVGEALDCPGEQLAELNAHALSTVCRYLDIDWTVEISSRMELDYSAVTSAGGWAHSISSQLKASAYVNPIGGEDLFDPHEFDESGIRLQFLRSHPRQYEQLREFEPGLSIIDVLMFNDPAAIREMLKDFELVDAPAR